METLKGWQFWLAVKIFYTDECELMQIKLRKVDSSNIDGQRYLLIRDSNLVWRMKFWMFFNK